MFIEADAKWLKSRLFAYLLISRHNSLQRGFGKSGTIWAPELSQNISQLLFFIPLLHDLFSVTFGRASIGKGDPFRKNFLFRLRQYERFFVGNISNNLENRDLHYSSFSTFNRLIFIVSSSETLGRFSSLYIFSIGYHQTGPFPLFP